MVTPNLFVKILTKNYNHGVVLQSQMKFIEQNIV